MSNLMYFQCVRIENRSAGGLILMARNIVGNVFQPPEMCAVEVFFGG